MVLRRFQKKGLVEDHLLLDMADLTPYEARIGKAESVSWTGTKSEIATIACRDSLRVLYKSTCTITGEKVKHSYSIRVERTPCHYGGVRHWFLCPRCGRRARILYLANGARPADCVFGCRICLGLTYHKRQTGRFMFNVYDLDQKGLPLLIRARRAKNPEKKARLMKRALMYWDGYCAMVDAHGFDDYAENRRRTRYRAKDSFVRSTF